MNKSHTTKTAALVSRRRFLLYPLALLGSHFLPTSLIAAPDAITSRKVDEGCPLNSGGESLLDSQWRIDSIYGNKIPPVVNMLMTVNKNSLSGDAGCNKYSATFKQVGYTGFVVTKINKGSKGCKRLHPVQGGRTINVGDLEGGYFRTLRRMGSVQQFKNRLVFYNRSGKPGIVMVPA